MTAPRSRGFPRAGRPVTWPTVDEVRETIASLTVDPGDLRRGGIIYRGLGADLELAVSGVYGMPGGCTACFICGRSVMISRRGTLYAHTWRDGYARCPASGVPATLRLETLGY